MTIQAKLKHCVGCRDNFYNGRGDGQFCWLLDKAKLVKKKQVALDQRPPWNQPPVKVLDCYRKQGYVFLDPTRTY
jgi:hypothetical protein